MFLQVPLLIPYFQEKSLLLVYGVYKKRCSKILSSLISLLFLLKGKNEDIIRDRVTLAALLRWKCWVAFPLLIMQDSCFEIKVSIQQTKLLPNLNLLNTEIWKAWSDELKGFSISIFTKNTSLLKMSVISVISAINLLLSPINRFLPYVVCCGEIELGRTFLNLAARASEIIL